ncbi:hypothetical protein NSQ26_05830 [Bacillus sp. FSL W7-1360]
MRKAEIVLRKLWEEMNDLEYALWVEIDAREYVDEDCDTENVKAIEHLKGQQKIAKMVLKIIEEGEHD